MKFSEKYEVRSYEVGGQNTLRPTQLIQILQETADHQMRDQAVDYTKVYKEEHKAFVVSRMNIEIFERIPKYEKIECRTWITEGRAANFPRAYEIISNGKVAVRAFSNWGLIDNKTKKLVRNEDYDMSRYAKDECPKMEIPERFRIPKDVVMNEVASKKVTYSMIDINRHMNNAIYASYLHDCIEGAEDYLVTSMNIRFKHEAPYGKILKISMSDFLDPGDYDGRADKIVFFSTQCEEKSNVEAIFGLKKA